MFSAPGELAFEQTPREEPAVVVFLALPGPERDGLQKGYPACHRIPSAPAVMRQRTQRDVQAGQVMAGLAARPKQPRNHQGPKPGPVLQRLDRGPSVEGECGREEGRQRAGVLDHASPSVEAGGAAPTHARKKGGGGGGGAGGG